MKISILAIILLTAATGRCALPNGTTNSPSDLVRGLTLPEKSDRPGDALLEGLKLTLEMEGHDCKNGDCSHYTLQDGINAMGAYAYVHGLIAGIRVLQIDIDGPRKVDFPMEGVDTRKLIKPLVDYLEKNPQLRTEDNSLTVYLFLKHYFSKTIQQKDAELTNAPCSSPAAGSNR